MSASYSPVESLRHWVVEEPPRPLLDAGCAVVYHAVLVEVCN